MVLAFGFNGVGIPVATTGLIQPVWAVVAMAVSVTAIFINSLSGQPSLFFEAISGIALGRGAHARGSALFSLSGGRLRRMGEAVVRNRLGLAWNIAGDRAVIGAG